MKTIEKRENLSNQELRAKVKEGACFREIWAAVKSERDIVELVELFHVQRSEYCGAVAGFLAEDAMDFIRMNRDSKTHQIGEIYHK